MKPPELQTAYTEQWKSGLDTRQGVFQNIGEDKFSAFRELTNCIVTVNGNLKTRPPLLDVGGTLATNSQGLLYSKGKFFTFGERGTVVTHIGNVASTVTTLLFDTPDDTLGYAGTFGQWTLLNYGVYQGYQYAIIQHGRNSVASPFINRLHIWDNRPNEPTYVCDPATPTDWSLGNYPQWAYGQGTGIIGVQKSYTPASEYAAEKLWISRADGNVAFSGIGRARIWNSRSVADIEQNGTMYYTRATTGGVYAITVPELFTDLSDLNGNYSGYITEYLTPGGGWIEPSIPAAVYASITPVWSTVGYTRITGGANVSIPDGGLVRVRFLAKPAVTIVSGVLLDPGGVTFTGDAVRYQFKTSFPTSATLDFPLAFRPSGFVLRVNSSIMRRTTSTVTGQFDLIDSGGLAQINFNVTTQTVTAANPVSQVQTTMNYADATNTDVPAILYINGVKQTTGFVYTNIGNLVRVDLSPTQNINGQTLVLALTPIAASVINLDGTNIIISSGKISQGGTQSNTSALFKTDLTGLTASTTYYLTVGGNIANLQNVATMLPSLRANTRIVATLTSDAAGNVLSYAAFVSPDLAQTPWYVARHQLNLTYFSGENEAAFINSSTHDDSGLPVTTMVAVKNRMVICYPRRTLLYQTSADLTGLAFIDLYAFGTNDPTSLLYNRPVINTQRGVRGFDLTGLNFQSLEDTNIGEAIQFLGILSFSSVAFWPWTGQYVAFGTLNNPQLYATKAKLDADSPLNNRGAIFGIFILSMSKESGTLAWSFNIVPGLTSSDIKNLIPVNGKLYTRSSTKMYYLDAEATVYTDAPQNTVIASRAVTHYNHLSAPNKLKRLISLSAVALGKLSFQSALNPTLAGTQVEWGPTLLNTTYGANRVPFTGTASAVSILLTANTAAGFELQNIQVEYVQAGRS